MGTTVTDDTNNPEKDPADSKADALAMVVVYAAAVAMAVHFISGWTFDF